MIFLLTQEYDLRARIFETLGCSGPYAGFAPIADDLADLAALVATVGYCSLTELPADAVGRDAHRTAGAIDISTDNGTIHAIDAVALPFIPGQGPACIGRT